MAEATEEAKQAPDPPAYVPVLVYPIPVDPVYLSLADSKSGWIRREAT